MVSLSEQRLCSLVTGAGLGTLQGVAAVPTYVVCCVSLSLSRLVEMAAADSVKHPTRGNREQGGNSEKLPGSARPQRFVLLGLRSFLHQETEKTPLSPALTPHTCLIKASRASGRAVTCEGRMLRRDEGHCTGTGRSQESDRGSGPPPGHRDVWAECDEGRQVPPVSGLSPLPVLLLTLAIRMDILEWQNPSSFGVGCGHDTSGFHPGLLAAIAGTAPTPYHRCASCYGDMSHLPGVILLFLLTPFMPLSASQDNLQEGH